jgi:uncharacterized RDD family membrane protein YckC
MSPDMNEATGLAPRFPAISGPWRRLLAFCLDGLVLGIVGAGIGLVAYDRLVALGDWGRALGFAIALIYFGVMDSRLSGGQTVGKRLAGIKVVTANAEPLGVGPATVRAAIFCVPYFLNGAFVTANGALGWLLVFLIFGVGLSLVYLLLFNRRTRQSLHDLAVGAYVVRHEAGDTRGGMEQMWPGHLGVVGVILIAALFLPLVSQRLASATPFAELLSVQQALQSEPDVRHASVFVGINKFFSAAHGTATTRVFSAKVILSRRVADFDSLAARLARIILSRDPSAAQEDRIAISMVYGYDIGIASSSRTRTFVYSPAQWRQRISSIGGEGKAALGT